MSDDAFFWALVAAPVLFIVLVVFLTRRRVKRHRAAWQIEAARKALEDDLARPLPEPSMAYEPPAEPVPMPLPPAPRKVRKRRPATVKQTKRLRAIKRRKK